MRNLIDRIEKFWCVTMHTATMWPIHGSYRCATCLREYPVGFEPQAYSRRILSSYSTLEAGSEAEYTIRSCGATLLSTGDHC